MTNLTETETCETCGDVIAGGTPFSRLCDTCHDLMGSCDTCDKPYDLADRATRCGDCGNCGSCCDHKEFTIELSSDCSCQYYDDNDELAPATDCYGDCYDDAREYLTESIEEWATLNNFADDALIRIAATGIGWRRLAGHLDLPLNLIPTALAINGDFRIVFTFSDSGKTLTAVRYSHDEPMGTGVMSFTLSPAQPCAYCGDAVESFSLDAYGDRICEYCGDR